jgi:hypothetical protein
MIANVLALPVTQLNSGSIANFRGLQAVEPSTLAVIAVEPNKLYNAVISPDAAAYFSYTVHDKAGLRSIGAGLPFLVTASVSGGGFIRLFGHRDSIPEYYGEKGEVAEPGWSFSNVDANEIHAGQVHASVMMDTNTTWYFSIFCSTAECATTFSLVEPSIHLPGEMPAMQISTKRYTYYQIMAPDVAAVMSLAIVVNNSDVVPFSCPYESFLAASAVGDSGDDCSRYIHSGFSCDVQESHPSDFGKRKGDNGESIPRSQRTVNCSVAQQCGFCPYAGHSVPAACPLQPHPVLDWYNITSSSEEMIKADVHEHLEGLDGCTHRVLNGHTCDDTEAVTAANAGVGPSCDFARSCGLCDIIAASGRPVLDGVLVLVSTSGRLPTIGDHEGLTWFPEQEPTFPAAKKYGQNITIDPLNLEGGNGLLVGLVGSSAHSTDITVKIDVGCKGEACTPRNCKGAWGACASDCAKLYTIEQPQVGFGDECDTDDKAIERCSPGEGDCPPAPEPEPEPEPDPEQEPEQAPAPSLELEPNLEPTCDSTRLVATMNGKNDEAKSRIRAACQSFFAARGLENVPIPLHSHCSEPAFSCDLAKLLVQPVGVDDLAACVQLQVFVDSRKRAPCPK